MERTVRIPMAEGKTANAYFYSEPGQPQPGVLFLTDAGGVRRSLREAAQRLASHGYSVLLPNIFFRVGDPPFFTPPLNLQDPQVRATFAALVGSVPPAAMEDDGGRYVDFLLAQPETASAQVAVVGHCMTGAMALRAAAARPQQVGAAASFHGGRLYTESAESPHLVLSRVKARLYFGHAVQDASMPAEAIEKLGSALSDWGGRYENETYGGALHGWTTTDSPVYNAPQAERAFRKLLELIAA
jgi:carboxymethylenebutenolidase